MAALAAARSGARVILADEQSEMGGSLLSSKEKINDLPATEWVNDVVSELKSCPEVMLLPRSTVNGYHDHNFLTIHERCTDHLADLAPVNTVRQRMHRVRAKWVVLATGAHERPLVFGNNDLPGSMLCGAISTYINRYSVVPGEKLVVMTTNDSGYQTALDWHEAGRQVVAVVDTRAQADSVLIHKATQAGIRVIKGSAVIEAQGSKRVTGVRVAPIDANGNAVRGKGEILTADTVATSGGFSPVVHLSCHTGSRPVWDDEVIGFVPGATKQKQLIAGAITGKFTTEAAMQQGIEAGIKAIQEVGLSAVDVAMPALNTETSAKPMALFHIPHDKKTSKAPKQFVDFQNDVTAAGIELACREGFESIEHVKRYTAMGFGTDQGKLGNINGMAITAKALNKTIPETGTTVFRPNYTPVTFGAIAGRNCKELFDPKRYTAMHQWHLEKRREI
ncbi:FAD-dependent oxidoreductase [Vibrio sp. CDRSL-10 TSBA]